MGVSMSVYMSFLFCLPVSCVMRVCVNVCPDHDLQFCRHVDNTTEHTLRVIRLNMHERRMQLISESNEYIPHIYTQHICVV